MAYTAADLETVRTARLRGIRTVSFADRSVTYASDEEMRQLEEDIKSSLAATSPTPRSKQAYGVSTKGF